MDFDNPKVYGDTSITDGLVFKNRDNGDSDPLKQICKMSSKEKESDPLG